MHIESDEGIKQNREEIIDTERCRDDIKIGFLESSPGVKSSTRLVLVVGAIIAYALSIVSFFFGLYLILKDEVNVIGTLIALTGVSIGPIFTFIGTLKLVQNGQENQEGNK